MGGWTGSQVWALKVNTSGLGETSESFFRQSSGTPVLARPFFNALTGAEDAELSRFPTCSPVQSLADLTSQLNGGGSTLPSTTLLLEGLRILRTCCQTVPTSSRLDGTLGYRYWQLNETLQVQERLTSLQTQNPGNFNITDRFENAISSMVLSLDSYGKVVAVGGPWML